MSAFSPTKIDIQNTDGQVMIAWADGHTSLLPIQRLRGYCPCAECQGHTSEIKWQENHTKGIFAATPVGRYAIQFQFADGHQTGIFRWESLRKLDPSEEAKWGRPEESLRC